MKQNEDEEEEKDRLIRKKILYKKNSDYVVKEYICDYNI